MKTSTYPSLRGRMAPGYIAMAKTDKKLTCFPAYPPKPSGLWFFEREPKLHRRSNTKLLLPSRVRIGTPTERLDFANLLISVC
jgi:hypothetical protein